MIPASDKFKQYLRTTHRRDIRVGLWTPNGSSFDFEGYFGVESGSITIDRGRNVARQGRLSVYSLESTIGNLEGAALRDYLEEITAGSAEITVEWGMQFSDLTEEWVTIARLRVEESSIEANGIGVEITSAMDAGVRLVDFYLVTPYAPFDINGDKLTYVEAIQDLVDTSYPSAAPPTWTVDASIDTNATPPDGTAFTGSRWDAVNSLAAGINASVGVDFEGNWFIRPKVVSDPVVSWVMNAGSKGVLVTESTSFSRRDQFNAVGVRWSSPSGANGLAYLVDNDPLSPTYYDGPFGRKPKPIESVDTIETEAQAIDYASSLLAESKGRTRSIALTAVHMPLLEPGDFIQVLFPDGSGEVHVVDTITLPLADATVSLQTRIVRAGVTYEESGLIYEDSGYEYSGQGV